MEAKNKRLPTLLKDELVIFFALLGSLLAILVVFTLPIWNLYPGTSFLILLLFFLIAFSISIWRLIYFVFSAKEIITQGYRVTCILLYVFLLIIAITIVIAGFLYWKAQGTVEFTEKKTIMEAKHSDGNRETLTFSNRPYGAGRNIGYVSTGTYVYVLGEGINMHGNTWYKTEFGWVYHTHLLELPKEEEIRLLNARLLEELKRRDTTVHLLTASLIFVLGSIATLSMVKYGKRKGKKREDETKKQNSQCNEEKPEIWAKKGLCVYCGGHKLFVPKCTSCGRL